MTLKYDLDNAQNLEQIIKCIQIGCVPEVPTNEDNGANRDKALVIHLEIAISVLKKLDILLSKLLKNEMNIEIKPQDISYACLYLCGEHCRSNFLWSNDESHSIMNLCVDKLCKFMHHNSIEELLTHLEVSKMLAGLQYKLEKDNWKKYPAAVECFMWTLKYLKIPHLNSLLYLVMPLPLNMFDDYQDSNVMASLEAFQHIIDNTPTAELAMSGHDVVLLSSLESSLQSSEYQLIPHILKCLLSLISKMQLKHLNKKNALEWTKFDDVMNVLLPRMEMEHKSEPAKCYASVFPLVLDFVGFACIRWSERLIPLFAEYTMHKYSTLATVKAIEVFIKQTWPRKSAHWNVLLTILIKALYNENNTDGPPCKENILAIVECIKTLEATRPESIRSVINQLMDRKELHSKKLFIETLALIL